MQWPLQEQAWAGDLCLSRPEAATSIGAAWASSLPGSRPKTVTSTASGLNQWLLSEKVWGSDLQNSRYKGATSEGGGPSRETYMEPGIYQKTLREHAWANGLSQSRPNVTTSVGVASSKLPPWEQDQTTLGTAQWRLKTLSIHREHWVTSQMTAAMVQTIPLRATIGFTGTWKID